MTIQDLKSRMADGSASSRLSDIYGLDAVPEQTVRYTALAETFTAKTGRKNFSIFSTSGRTELGGNHTDHNHGQVLAASVQLDTLACAEVNGTNIVEILSAGYPAVSVDISLLDHDQAEAGTTHSLVRGIAARFAQLGFKTGGFTAVTVSSVPGGSGLSSSAAIEVLIGTVFNHFFNDAKIDAVELAQIGQWAENNFFGKPCGLMDQVACGYGGIVKIDFKDPKAPIVENVSFDFKKAGYTLMVVNTGGSHADLTDEYAAVPKEMKSVAEFFGKTVCREITKEQLLSQASAIREKCGDRAFLRALHFLDENNRAAAAVETIRTNNIQQYLNLVKSSGNSSWKYLQNCTSIKDVHFQGVTTALALTEEFLDGDGACRVHGGGFAGTIQVYIPNTRAQEYKDYIENLLGTGCVTELRIRNMSTAKVF